MGREGRPVQLKYGSYAFDANATTLTSSSRTRVNEGGQQLSLVRSFSVQGYLSADGQAAVTTAMNALKAALATPYQDLTLLTDAGASSSDLLLNAGSLTGVLVTEGPTFGDSRGAEYATVRSFQFTAQAEYPVTGSQRLLVSFTESLSFSGGGPLYAVRRAINGPPQRQLIYPQTEYRCVQQGMAVGYRAYPVPPAPKFPQALRESPDVRQRSPRRMGNGYAEYPVEWTYVFESAGPLSAAPTLWIS